jgi:hypothetical protein
MAFANQDALTTQAVALTRRCISKATNISHKLSQLSKPTGDV